TQGNASTAEELASTAEELNSQLEILQENVRHLRSMIHGRNGTPGAVMDGALRPAKNAGRGR
ncbi:hypothetical protein JW933_00235, partial [candidate division FCPU426 bacterium]|nr:hypothetical protein [candidate division FCPU426 bacterium]